jgi:5'-deoxynucleotidase
VPSPRAPGDTTGAEATLDLLRELQALDRVPRIGYAMHGVGDPESVSEHLFHVVFVVWSLAPRVPGLDTLKAVELALIHDLAEVRFGDLPRTAAHYLPAGAKAAAERSALADLLAPLGEEHGGLLAEYQTGKTLEARFVAVCDKLQLLIKAGVYEDWGDQGAKDFRSNLDQFDDGGFAAVAQLVAVIRRRIK